MNIIIILSAGVMVYSLVMLLIGQKAERRLKIRKRLFDVQNQFRMEEDDEVDEENLSFFERVMKPLVDLLIRKVAELIPLREDQKEKIQKKLFLAGINMKYRDYMAMNLIIMVLAGFVGGFYGYSTGNFFTGILYFIVGVIFGYFITKYSIARKTRIRSEKMEAQFPEFLDLLSVCIEAGLGFDQAVGYVVREYPSDLSSEFKVYLRDIALGETRKQALTSVEERCNIESLKTFNAAILQADEMGISLKNVLAAQSRSVRDRRRQQVEEQVQKLPVKILFPIMIFIFPIIFIVLMTPAVISIFNTLGSM